MHRPLRSYRNPFGKTGLFNHYRAQACDRSYQLIAGEHLRAAKWLASLVPIVIRRSTDREALQLALIENIQRQIQLYRRGDGLFSAMQNSH